MVLLYAVLLVSIVLTISLSLMNITYKQIILTAVNKESQVAHFVALSVFDCAKFTNSVHQDEWGDDELDNPFGVFTSPTVLIKPAGNLSSFDCGSINGLITATVATNPPGDPGDPVTLAPTTAVGIISRYTLLGLGLGGSCGEITVVKVASGNYSDEFPDSTGDDVGKTFYTALGYNTCDLTSSRLVERMARKKE
ncbi:MAG: hypothetical protein V1704_01275 [Candidatus Vogelbacteria bacterium]